METALAGWGKRISNSQMSLPKLVFEVWPEFPFISERSAIRHFSRLSSSSDLHRSPVQNEYGALRSSHAREAASPDPRVRILPPHQPVRSPLCFFRVCENNLVRRALTQGRSPNVWSSSRSIVVRRSPGSFQDAKKFSASAWRHEMPRETREEERLT